MHIAIIGKGVFGQALANVWQEHSIVFIDRATPLALTATAEVLVFALPNTAVSEVCEKLRPHYQGQTIISCSKGVDSAEQTATERIAQLLKTKNVLALSGPSLAKDMDKPTQILLAGNNANVWAEKLSTDTFQLIAQPQAKSLELIGAYKNILCILSGYCVGLDLGHNFAAAALTQSYHEFCQQNKELLGDDLITLGLGDYFLSTSGRPRNERFGQLKAQGKSTQQALNALGTVEGYDMLSQLREPNFFPRRIITCLQELLELSNQDTMRNILLETFFNKKNE